MELTDFFADATSHLVAFVPTRNVLKDQIMDRLLGLTDCRNALVQTTPDEVWEILSRRFAMTDRQNIFWMGDLTCWKKR